MTYTLDTLTPAEKERALHRSINALREDDPMRSASIAIMGWQKGVIYSALLIAIVCAVWQPMGTAVVLVGICTMGYVATMADRVFIFRRGLESRPIVVSDEQV